MRNLNLLMALGASVLLLSCGSKKPSQPVEQPGTASRFSATPQNISIGGMPVIRLSPPVSRDMDQMQIVSADILPGRGMNTFQLVAHVPGRGDFDMLASPTLEDAQKKMNGGPDDLDGDQSFQMGGAILLPFANRIRGKLSPDGKTLTTEVDGKTVTLIANWHGKKRGAPRHAMHGLILARRMDEITTEANTDEASVTGSLDAGNFQGHWLSKAHVEITATLSKTAFGIKVVAKNIGNEDLPMGIGWHPYFVVPSGKRAQVRLHLPALRRALVNNYDDVFPTGKIVPVKGTRYDFTAPDGAPLDKLFLDDCFLDLQRDKSGNAVAQIVDPAWHYGIRVTSSSPQVHAIQVYSPLDRNIVVLEPQFNLADPFSKVWGKKVDTGMVILKPGESVTYSAKVELFLP